ncbi:MAG: 6-phosphogluconolactonase [Candidatus Aenigmatarchaeota archaeon]
MALKVFITRDYEGMSDMAYVSLSIDLIRKTNIDGAPFNLGLATGSSPVGLYKRLAAYQHTFDPSLMETWNLDEYAGLHGKMPADRAAHKESYYRFMCENLFSKLEPKLKDHHIPKGYRIDAGEMEHAIRKGIETGDVTLVGKDNGKAVIFSQKCTDEYLRKIDAMNKDYVKSMEDAGGIDWWVVGSGEKGHIGFHESGIPLNNDMFLVQLDENTRRNAKEDGHFGTYEEVPRYAMTVGAGGVARLSRNVMLLASGERKTEAVAKSLIDPITDEVPISILQRYIGREGSDALYVIDEVAASEILGRKKQLAGKGIELTDMRQ